MTGLSQCKVKVNTCSLSVQRTRDRANKGHRSIWDNSSVSTGHQRPAVSAHLSAFTGGFCSVIKPTDPETRENSAMLSTSHHGVYGSLCTLDVRAELRTACCYWHNSTSNTACCYGVFTLRLLLTAVGKQQYGASLPPTGMECGYILTKNIFTVLTVYILPIKLLTLRNEQS